MSEPVRFLIAGVQKGGATALRGYLRDHRGVQVGGPCSLYVRGRVR